MSDNTGTKPPNVQATGLRDSTAVASLNVSTGVAAQMNVARTSIVAQRKPVVVLLTTPESFASNSAAKAISRPNCVSVSAANDQ